MKTKEWREKSTGELEKEVELLNDKLRDLRFRILSREEKNHQLYRKARLDRARILTILSERTYEAEQQTV